MKKNALLFVLLLAATLFAQEDRYTKFMNEQLLGFDTASSVSSYQKLANSFERIASVEKAKWQPYYYASMCNVLSSMQDSAKDMKDLYLDKASSLLDVADSLDKNNSEIYTMKGLLGQARMLVNPMERWMKYGQAASDNLEKAKGLDTTNPRPWYLLGQTAFYTPEQLGGGKAKAMPILLKAKELYDNFKPKTPLDPVWGKKQLDEFLARVKN